MKLQNPYVIKKHDKIRELETSTDAVQRTNIKTEIATYEEMSRQVVQEYLDTKQSNINHVETQVQEIKSNYPTISAQYKAMIQLHRDAKQLCDDIKIAKKDLIEEIKSNRKKRT